MNPADYHAQDDETLRRTLSGEQYAVTRQSATEKPFRNVYHDEFRAGIYVDITSGEPLFASADKFESGLRLAEFRPNPLTLPSCASGWTHRWGACAPRCAAASATRIWGNVFSDGPEALGGLRYCINSASLRFIPREDMAKEGYGAFLNLAQEPKTQR